MEGLGTTKIMAAVLMAGIAYSGLSVVADLLVHPKRLAQSAIKIEGGAAPAASEAAEAPKGPAPIEPMMAKADVTAGEAQAKKQCGACHNFAEGAGAKVGPGLYGVLGRAQASVDGFQYSSGLKAHSGKWDYAALNSWLYNPKSYAPGTKMAFAGISDDMARANVIAYLRSLSHTPEPMPAAK